MSKHHYSGSSFQTALHAPKKAVLPLPYAPSMPAPPNKPAPPTLRYYLPTARFGPAHDVPAESIWLNPTILQKIDAATALAMCSEPVDVQVSGDQLIPVHPVAHAFIAALLNAEHPPTTISIRIRLA